jgi:hypothetical protein
MSHENKILITFVKASPFFDHMQVMHMAGRENAKQGDLGTIMLPVHAKDAAIDPTLPDVEVFSYSNTEGDVIRLRVVEIKMQRETKTPAGMSSSCTVSVVVPSVEGNWVTRTANIKLVAQDGTTEALFNPHGMIEEGDYLYFIDYESQLIVYVEKDALEGAADNSNVVVNTIDLTEIDYGELPSNARGQALIAVNGKIIALYIVTDSSAQGHYQGRLLRFGVNSDGSLTNVEAQTLVGLNPQSIIPVITKDANNADIIKLLIPCIGGRQDYNGATNGVLSDIRVVDALGTWPTTQGEADIAVTGDPPPAPQEGRANPPKPEATAYDIHAIGAAMRNGNSLIYILTQVYVDGGKGAYWMLYQTTVDEFLGLLSQTPRLTLTGAVNAGILRRLDEGIVIAPEYEVDPEDPDPLKVPYAIYFWGIVYEQTLRNDDEEDRVYLFLGSPFLITKAEAYSSPTTKQENPYVVVSGFGGPNTNSIDATIETLHQAVRKVSLHRGVRAAKIALARPAAEEENK